MGNRLMTQLGGYLMPLAMAVAFFSHVYNLFQYPIFLGDEGIYMEQAWAVVRLDKLSPYTYWYDHAPAGWLMIAAWVSLLPGKFHQWGMAINSGRVFMVLLHVVSVALLYRLAKRFSGSDWAAFATCLIFSLTPLGLYYQRMVLLDNVMVFWLLLALYLVMASERRLLTLLGSGLAYGMALLTKENAFFFAPVMGWVLYREVKGTHRYSFALTGFIFTTLMVVSLYPLYAILKNELFPPGLETIFGGKPQEHVSLLNTLIWQLGRRGGSILDPDSQFWFYFSGRPDGWWQKDWFFVVAGTVAMLANLLLGWKDRERHGGQFVASLLALSFTFYLIRGSQILEFYVVPLLPFYALNMGLLLSRLIMPLPGALRLAGWGIALAMLVYFDIQGAYDAYHLNLTRLQAAQLQFIRENVPASAFIITDDDLWVDLHEPSGANPVYPKAHSHWKVESDPEIRYKLLKDDWRNADYFAVSADLDFTLRVNAENFVLQALENSRPLAGYRAGRTLVEVRQINK